MEIGKVLMEAFGLKEDQSKNDLSIVKRGLSVELHESRNVADHIQWMGGETTVAQLKELFENLAPVGHYGHVMVCVSAQEECPRFMAFLKKQAKRLKFKLVVFVSPLPPEKLVSMEQPILERGGLRMQ